MDIKIFGLVGHSGGVTMRLEDLELDELDLGREFIYRGHIYEIRSVMEQGDALVINVVATMEVPDA